MKLLSAEYTAKQIVDASKDLEKFAAQYQEIQAEIKEKSPRYAQLMYPEPIVIKDLQKQLTENTLLLEYWLGEEHSYLWLISPTQIETIELPKRQEIEELAIKFHQLLRSRNDYVRYYNGKPLNQTLSPEQADKQMAEVAYSLSNILLKPVAAKLGKAKLLIVGEKSLHFIPFAALPNPNDQANKTPMMVEHEIINLPSAFFMLTLRQNTNNKNTASKTIEDKNTEDKNTEDKNAQKSLVPSVAVLSDPIFSVIDERVKKQRGINEETPTPSILQTLKDPAHLSIEVAYRAAEDVGLLNEGYRMPRLPLAQLEAKQIANAIGTEKTKQISELAVNRSVINSDEIRQYPIIHFATYTFLNSKHPNASGITLSLFDKAAKEQDNFLKLKDLYNLNLPTELLVFSAGGTTLGNEVRAEGFYALSRGLIYSGANRAIFSLWTVNDEARAELMNRFYQELSKQKQFQPAAALRAAQIAIWEQKRWQSPYYWAPFILLSDGK
jgi:CHAT domain-containing protein